MEKIKLYRAVSTDSIRSITIARGLLEEEFLVENITNIDNAYDGYKGIITLNIKIKLTRQL